MSLVSLKESARLSSSRGHTAAFLACGLMVLSSSAFAQGSPGLSASDVPLPTLKLSTQVVVLDVVVTDRKGNLVQRNLRRGDFAILEDKAPQVLRSFEPPEEHRMSSTATVVVRGAQDLPKIGDAPVVLLVLDELNSRFEDMSFARQMLVKYLQGQPAILPQPTLLAVAENRSFRQLHDYTQSRDELLQLIKKHVPQYPSLMMGSRNSGPGAVERMAQVLATLQQLAQSSLGTRGRKNLIWVGSGFPSADLTGLNDTDGNQIQSAIRHCTAMLLASRITMYTINPAPGTAATVDVESVEDLEGAVGENGSDPFGGTVTFSNFAPATGGIAFTGRNDLNNVIGEGIAKGDFYYTLSYSPSDKAENPAHFRNIRIVMADPDLRASTREGYYAATSQPAVVAASSVAEKQARAKLQLDLSSAIKSTISYNGLKLSAESGSDGRAVIHVRDPGLGWSPSAGSGSQHAEATVVAAWYDAKGKLIDHMAREETSVRGQQEGATYTLLLSLPSTARRVRFVVRDALNGNMGSLDEETSGVFDQKSSPH